MKKTYLFLGLLLSLSKVNAQILSKLHWFNEPEKWDIKNNALIMQVTPKSDYWRISHYGF